MIKAIILTEIMVILLLVASPHAHGSFKVSLPVITDNYVDD